MSDEKLSVEEYQREIRRWKKHIWTHRALFVFFYVVVYTIAIIVFWR